MFASGTGGRGQAGGAGVQQHGGGMVQHVAGGPASVQQHYVAHGGPHHGVQYAQQLHPMQPAPPPPRPPSSLQNGRVGYDQQQQHFPGGRGGEHGQHVVMQQGGYLAPPGQAMGQPQPRSFPGGPVGSSPQMAVRQGPSPAQQHHLAYEQQQRFLQPQQRQQHLEPAPPPSTPFSTSAPSPSPYSASPSQGPSPHQRVPTGHSASSPAQPQRIYHHPHQPSTQPYPPHHQPSQLQPSSRPHPGPSSQIHHSVEQAIAASLPPSSPARGPPPPQRHPHQPPQAPSQDHAQAHARMVQQQQRQAQAARLTAEQHLRSTSAMAMQDRRGSIEEVVPVSAQLQQPVRQPVHGQYLQPGSTAYALPAQQQQSPQRRTTGEAAGGVDEMDQRTIFHGYLLDYLQKAGYYSTATALLSDIPSIPTHSPSSGRVYPSSTYSLAPTPVFPTTRNPNSQPLFLTSPSALSPQKLSPQSTGQSPARTPSPTRATANGGEPQNADTVGSTTSTSSSMSSAAVSHFGFEGSGTRRMNGGIGGTDDEAELGGEGGGKDDERRKGMMPAAKVMMESEEGFLYEWWNVFWDVFRARSNHPAGSSPSARDFVAASTAAAQLAMQRHGMGPRQLQRPMAPPTQQPQQQQQPLRRKPSAIAMNGIPPPPPQAHLQPPQHYPVAPPAGRAPIPVRKDSFTTAPSPIPAPAPALAPSPNSRRGSLTGQQAQQIHQQQLQRAQEAAMMAAQQTRAGGQGQGQGAGQNRMTARRGALPPDDNLVIIPSQGPPPPARPLSRQHHPQLDYDDPQRELYERQQQPAQSMPMALPPGKGRQQGLARELVTTPPQQQGDRLLAGGSPQKMPSNHSTPPFQRGTLAYNPGELQHADEARAAYRARLVATQQSQMVNAMQRSQSQGLTPLAASPPMPLPVPDGARYLMGPDGKRIGAGENGGMNGAMPPPQPSASSNIAAGRRGAVSQGNTPAAVNASLPPGASPTKGGEAAPSPPAFGARPSSAAGDAAGNKRRRPSLTPSVSETRESKKRALQRPPSASGNPHHQPVSGSNPSAPSSATPLASGLVDITESPASPPLDMSFSASSGSADPLKDAGAQPEISLEDTNAFLNSLGGANGVDQGGLSGLDFGLDDGSGEQVSMEQLDAFLASSNLVQRTTAFDDHAATIQLNDSAAFDYNEFLSGFGGDGGGSYDPATVFDLTV